MIGTPTSDPQPQSGTGTHPEELSEELSEEIPEEIPEELPAALPEQDPAAAPVPEAPSDTGTDAEGKVAPENLPSVAQHGKSDPIPESIPESTPESIPEELPVAATTPVTPLPGTPLLAAEEVEEEIPEEDPQEVLLLSAALRVPEPTPASAVPPEALAVAAAEMALPVNLSPAAPLPEPVAEKMADPPRVQVLKPEPSPEPEPACEETGDLLDEEELEGEPSSREWWILPLVAAVMLFLAGIGAGRFLVPPWAKESAHAAKPTVLSMAAPVAPVSDAPASVNDSGAALPAAVPAKPESGPTVAPAETAPVTGAAEGKATATSPVPPPLPTAPTATGEIGPVADEVTAQPQPVPEDDLEIGLQYEESLPHEPPSLPEPPPPGRRDGTPRVAVVIDDLGYNVPVSLAIARLPYAVTLAILPGGDGSRQVAFIGKSTHKEVILHQPMEPLGYPRIKPGPGALLAGMGAEEIRPIVSHNLEKFPEAVGINNHMGSRLTQDRAAMDVVMGLLKERGLFFLDSRTSQTSVAYARARAHGLPAARRDVFLDNVQRVSAIEARLAELEHIARVTGRAIAIGHPYRETLTALQGWLPAVTKRGIQVEGISHFLNREPTPRSSPEAQKEKGTEREKGTDKPEKGADKSVEASKPVKLKSETTMVKPAPTPARSTPTPPEVKRVTPPAVKSAPATPPPVSLRPPVVQQRPATSPAANDAEQTWSAPPVVRDGGGEVVLPVDQNP
ncbi:MAG: divergent polysaccharide deacetylase family protein [Magnetococcales bacterium]|nr:divergent polysaccharide deacetylase family protein [Magnetococcales bacterium]